MIELITFYQEKLGAAGPELLLFNIVTISLLVWGAVRISLTDLFDKEIPNNPLYAILILGLFVATMKPAGHPGLNDALIGGAFGSLMFIWARLITEWLKGSHAIGFGEVKLAGVIGVWVGWEETAVVMFLSSVLGVLLYLVICHHRKKHHRPGSPLFSFSPALCLSLVIILVLKMFVMDRSTIAIAGLY